MEKPSMAAILDFAKNVFSFGSSGNPTEPDKAMIIRLFGLVEAILGTAVNGLIVGSAVVYQTRAALFANLARPDGSLGIVYGDSNPAYNGYYAKVGASGSGSWTLTNLALPSTFAADLAGVLNEVVTARGGFPNLAARFQALADAIAAGGGEAGEAIAALQQELDAETSARNDADTALSQALTAEISDREDAIAAEQEDRAQAIADERSALNAEISTREGDIAEIKEWIIKTDGDGGFVFQDEDGFVVMRIAADGTISNGKTLYSNSEDGAFSVRDEAGFSAFKVTPEGDLRFGGSTLKASDTAFSISDELGFIGLLFDDSGLRINGQPVGSPSADVVAAIVPAAIAKTSNVYGKGPHQLPKLRKAKARVLQGLGPALIGWVGDSNTIGTQGRPASHPAIFAKLVDRMFGGNAANVFGTAGYATTAEYSTYDARLVFGSGWGFATGVSLGGNMYRNSTTTSALAFTPGVMWDTAVILAASSAASSFSADIGGAATTFTPAAGSIQKLTYTAARGNNPLNIKRISGDVQIIGMYVYDSTVQQILALNMGRGGWTCAEWLDRSSFFSPANALDVLGLHAAFVELGLNELNTGIAPATFGSNLASIVSNLQNVGTDAIIVSSVTPGGTYTYGWGDYVTAMYGAADLSNAPLVDITARMGSRGDVEANGFNDDPLHPSKFGLADKASALFNFFSSI